MDKVVYQEKMWQPATFISQRGEDVKVKIDGFELTLHYKLVRDADAQWQ